MKEKREESVEGKRKEKNVYKEKEKRRTCKRKEKREERIEEKKKGRIYCLMHTAALYYMFKHCNVMKTPFLFHKHII